MTNILIAPNAFKGTFSPIEVARAMKLGVETFLATHDLNGKAEISLAPLADGGDGTVEALYQGVGGHIKQVQVHGALGEERIASWLKLGRTAVVELASACGLAGLPLPLSPLTASTVGLGEVIIDAAGNDDVASDCTEIVIAVGGSASTDGGTGALSALGVHFLEFHNKPLQIRGGATLLDIANCDFSALDQLRSRFTFKIITDVVSPLCGPQGAAAVFGPQKGASPYEVELLDRGLSHFADVVEPLTSQWCTRDTPGSGAAGGTAFGLANGLRAEILPGFAWISDLIDLPGKVAAADLVITGEGRVDQSTIFGKAVAKLWEQCCREQKKLMVIAGSIEENISVPAGVHVQAAVRPGQVTLATCEDISRATAFALRDYFLC